MIAPVPKVLLLDFDGTIADSEPALFDAYGQFLRSHGATGSRGEFDSLVGPSITEIVRILQERYRMDQDVDLLEAEYRAMVRDAYLHEVRLMPRVVDTLRAVSQAGIAAYVVTSAPADLVTSFLRKHHLDRMVAGVVSADGLGRAKPDPEVYAAALADANVLSQDAIAIEDSPAGMASALGARIRTVMIGEGALLEHEASDPRFLGRAGDVWAAWCLAITSRP